MKIIVLSVTPYKEKSAIVNAINEEKTISFTVHNLLGNKSEFNFLNIPLTIADITLTEGKAKYKTLKSANLVFNPLTLPQSIQVLTAVSFLREFVNKLVEDAEKYKLYNPLIECLTSLNEGSTVYMPLIYLGIRALAASGYELNLSSCVRCGDTKEIYKFSFVEGGFICKKCYDDTIKSDLTINQMKIIRYAGLCTKCKFDTLNLNKEDIKIVFERLIDFINDCFGITFKNINLLSD